MKYNPKILNLVQNISLRRKITREEVERTITWMGSRKLPRSNGFTANLFKIVGKKLAQIYGK